MISNNNHESFCSCFLKQFQACKGRRIAIYGTGNNSRIILENITDFDFICVISESMNSNSFCGIKECSLEEAKFLVDVIIIAAVPISTAIIYKRISRMIPTHIDVYDMRGHLLNKEMYAKDYLQSISVSETEKSYSDLLCNELAFTISGKLCIDSYKVIAYLIAPITIKYIEYIISYAKEYDYVLFASRDGYFLHELYSEFIKEIPGNWAKGIYFYTSRKALEKACLCKDDKYIRYIDSLGLGGNGAVVDIVTQGSVCNGFFRLTGYTLDLIALGTTAIPNKYIRDTKTVHSLFGNINEEIDGIPYSLFDFSELHLFLEMLYASKDGQLLEFSEELTPIFDTSSKYNEELISMVQMELKTILKIMIKNGYIDFSNNYVMHILNLFYNNYASYEERIKAQFVFDDPYDDRLQKCNLIDKLGW